MMLEGTRKMECWRDTAPAPVEIEERQEVSESEAEERRDGFSYDQHC